MSTAENIEEIHENVQNDESTVVLQNSPTEQNDEKDKRQNKTENQTKISSENQTKTTPLITVLNAEQLGKQKTRSTGVRNKVVNFCHNTYS